MDPRVGWVPGWHRCLLSILIYDALMIPLEIAFRWEITPLRYMSNLFCFFDCFVPFFL